jgi:hypothetical protein
LGVCCAEGCGVGLRNRMGSFENILAKHRARFFVRAWVEDEPNHNHACSLAYWRIHENGCSRFHIVPIIIMFSFKQLHVTRFPALLIPPRSLHDTGQGEMVFEVWSTIGVPVNFLGHRASCIWHHSKHWQPLWWYGTCSRFPFSLEI